MRNPLSIAPDQHRDDARESCERCSDAWNEKLDIRDEEIMALKDKVAELTEDIERISKERDEWREAYAAQIKAITVSEKGA